MKTGKLTAIDLFCGAGGLTHGLTKAGIKVVAGIDLDPKCKYPFEANNQSKFIQKNITDVTPDELLALYPENSIRILVGCAPCQQFSRYGRRHESSPDKKWGMIRHFSRLVGDIKPAIVSMENVPELATHDVFRIFKADLANNGYQVTTSKIFCPDYGVPQSRTRLVMFASSLGELNILPPTRSPAAYETVRQAIGDTPALEAGQCDSADLLHRASNLSRLNMERILASSPGGCWREWPEHLIAACHRAKTGKDYPSIYGRMEWDKPAPTITTQFFGFGSGRFGHPVQNRAISLREGALLQTFPKSYRFSRNNEDISFSSMGRLIGNAVPVRLGEVIGNSIIHHIQSYHGKRT